MKRCMSMVFAVSLLLIGLFTVKVDAAEKNRESRTIAVVFDNSGSMYVNNSQAWCRATYAMEVFASMLNKGDVLQIYPMCPITVDGNEYTMKKPLQITDAAQASIIRDISTPYAIGTPIESVDCAINGLQQVQGRQKYLIILTDGTTFSENNSDLSAERTKNELGKRIQTYAGSEMTIMYLGIGYNSCVPNTEQRKK